MTEAEKIALQYLFAEDTLYLIPEKKTLESGIEEEVKAEAILPIKEEVQKPVIAPPVVVEEVFVPQVNHQVLILVEHLSEADKDLLTKIIAAVKLDLTKVEVLDLATIGKANLRPVLSSRAVKQLVTFGIPLFTINLEIPLIPYQVRTIQGVHFLYADMLSELQNDVPKKKALWGALKQMFTSS